MKQVVIDYDTYHKEKDAKYEEGVGMGLWLAYKYLTNSKLWALKESQWLEKQWLDEAKAQIAAEASVMS